jgi:serine/threonine-protein kinase
MNVALSKSHRCPDCGTRLAAEPWAAGLCLTCLVELGLSAGAEAAGGEQAEAEAATEARPAGALEPGQVLGSRYRIRSRLCSGGMGEVFRAFDLKLRVDLALKTLRPTLPGFERARRALRQEVRTAREVVSNVCRVFDLVELGGLELVSMEFVDGVTLADVLRERSPLGLQEARELASQFLAGLEAIHAAGLVHRDVKPENLMLTRAGRVVVMDFGIARALAEAQAGTVSGTPAYMAPEQAQGEAADARADVFSAGVVLAEMVAPLVSNQRRGARSRRCITSRRRSGHLGRGAAQAVANPYTGNPTAAASRARSKVTLRTAGDEAQRRTRPRLVHAADAAYFVGRELRSRRWKKLRQPPARLDGLRRGQSSFCRRGSPRRARQVAGHLRDPRDRPFAARTRNAGAGDTEAVAPSSISRPDVVDLGRWRRRDGALVLDQFELLQARPR